MEGSDFLIVIVCLAKTTAGSNFWEWYRGFLSIHSAPGYLKRGLAGTQCPGCSTGWILLTFSEVILRDLHLWSWHQRKVFHSGLLHMVFLQRIWQKMIHQDSPLHVASPELFCKTSAVFVCFSNISRASCMPKARPHCWLWCSPPPSRL